MNTYRNSTEVCQLNGQPIYLEDVTKACLIGGLNLFLQGDTGSGKTQLARDVMDYFPDSMFILGRNDMDTRELFQQINPEFLKSFKKGNIDSGMKYKKLTDKINYNFIGVDELPNCVPSVRAQLFNLFDGFIEIDGKAYPLGGDYCVGMATGNVGQQFTESSNELGRALRDRMHLIIDTDYFRPQSIDTLDMLTGDTNPRVNFGESLEEKTDSIVEKHKELIAQEIPFEKYIIASYLLHALDYLEGGKSKIELKSKWPNTLEGHESGSDAALILPVSPRAAKSIITLSQGLDQITKENGAEDLDYFNSMMTAFKFVSAYSGVLNESTVINDHYGNHYTAMDAVIDTTKSQFDNKKEVIAAGLEMAKKGKKDKKLLDEFPKRWYFMKDLLEDLSERYLKENEIT
jgi:hypothetical protein